MMFTFTEEQHQLRRELRRFFQDSSPASEVRRLMDTEAGYDRARWNQMATQLGLHGLAIPERFGGSGFGPVEQLIALEEMGRALLCAPYLSSVVLAANALRCSGDEAAQKDLLPGIAAGQTIATLAVAEHDGAWSTDESATTAHPIRTRDDSHGYRVRGHKSFVLDGHVADLLLVTAHAGGGPSLFAIDADAPGLRRRRLETLDPTRKQAELDFNDVPARLIGVEGAATEVITATLRLATIALAGEQVGGAQRCLDMAVDYAKLRVQFGRPIGSFQAIKHKCADMLLDVESARSAAYYAAWAAQDNAADLPLVASLAKAYCSEVYSRAAADNIQIHGGIGFTWDHDAHLYYRRAKSTEMMLGSPTHHREIVAGHLLDDTHTSVPASTGTASINSSTSRPASVHSPRTPVTGGSGW